MSRFGRLRSVVGNTRRSVSELFHSDTGDPEPEAFTHSSTEVFDAGYEVNRPPRDDLQKYWRLFETVPIIRQPVTNLSSEVIEPGWFVTADDDDTADTLTEFLEQAAIVEGEVDRNFSELVRKIVVEREVRGTALVEKVPDDNGNTVALNPLQVQTFEIYTKPGTSILIGPTDTDIDGVKLTENGQASSYVQFDNKFSKWDNRPEKRFTRDDIIKVTRDADIGEVFGTSRIESVAQRANGLIRKLDDNDDAISTKAWPIIVFQGGTEENPWTLDEMNDFMEAYKDEKLTPGTMTGVTGEMSIDTFSGEVADIGEAVQTDVNMIISNMPGPKYSLGGFSEDVGKAVAGAQERQYKKLVRDIRRELEDRFTPVLEEVAEQHDDLNNSGIQLHIARPEGQVPPEDVSGSIIRYTSDSPQGGRQTRAPGVNPNPEGDGQSPGRGSPRQGNESNEQSHTIWSVSADVDELADPRFVSVESEKRELASIVDEALVDARDSVIEELDARFDDTSVLDGDTFDGIARGTAGNVLDRSNVERRSSNVMTDVVEATLDTLAQENHDPTIEVAIGARHRQRARHFASNVERSVRDAIEEMLDRSRQQVEHASRSGEDMDRVLDRIEETFGDDELEDRAELIAHMETKEAIEATKFVEYERHEDVVGVRVINICNENTTRLCEHLAGCGARDEAVARFDSDRPIGEQFAENAPDSTLFEGFRPLPASPPFHFRCTSSLLPVTVD